MMNKYEKLELAVLEHNRLVNKIWNLLVKEYSKELNLTEIDFILLDEKIKQHDVSKLGGCEIEGFADMYESGFDGLFTEQMLKAYNKHIVNNTHHWEHWVLYRNGITTIEMPFLDVIEMLCDWTATILENPNQFKSVSSFYDSTKETILLKLETEKLVGGLLPLFDNVFNLV